MYMRVLAYALITCKYHFSGEFYLCDLVSDWPRASSCRPGNPFHRLSGLHAFKENVLLTERFPQFKMSVMDGEEFVFATSVSGPCCGVQLTAGCLWAMHSQEL